MHTRFKITLGAALVPLLLSTGCLYGTAGSLVDSLTSPFRSSLVYDTPEDGGGGDGDAGVPLDGAVVLPCGDSLGGRCGSEDNAFPEAPLPTWAPASPEP
ncbi:MAG: hypothetical protein AB8I08_06075 [Sandaracinaceae bacterium]